MSKDWALPKDPKGNWFRENPEAQRFTEVWMEMSAAGTTNITFTEFHQTVLRVKYKFPWRDRQSFGRWMDKAFGDTYRRAMAPRRTR